VVGFHHVIVKQIHVSISFCTLPFSVNIEGAEMFLIGILLTDTVDADCSVPCVGFGTAAGSSAMFDRLP